MNSNSDPTSMLLVLLNEILSDILSRLPFKTLMQLKCVCKSLKTLISDPAFAKLRLQKSLCDASLALIPNWSNMLDTQLNCSVVPFPMSRLIEDAEITIDNDPYYLISDKDCCRMVGLCNGLICLLGYSAVAGNRNWLRFWNPATHSLSEKLFLSSHGRRTKFTFGYDISTKTYKVVAYSAYDVKILTLGDNIWRNIQSFPVVPFEIVPHHGNCHPFVNKGVYVSGTINWLAIRNMTEYEWSDITIEQFVIVSLDLATETYQQLLPPQGFVEVPTVEPSVTVLMDCLCFSYCFEGYFVLWKMMEFGVQDSWTQFLKISFQDLQIDDYDIGIYDFLPYDSQLFLFPLCVSESRNTLIMASNQESDYHNQHAILYDWIDNKVGKVRYKNEVLWFFAEEYVESLASTTF